MFYQGPMSLLGMFEWMKNSWRILVSLRGLHTTPHIILEISAFLSYMVMHTVYLRLEYGPEEQNALLSLQLTMHSLFLWATHFQEIQLHVLAATASREISKDGLNLSIAISTSGLQTFTRWHWPVACVPKAGPSISKPGEETSAFQKTASKVSGKMHTQREDALGNPRKIAQFLCPPLAALYLSITHHVLPSAPIPWCS